MQLRSLLYRTGRGSHPLSGFICAALLGLGPPAFAADTQFIVPSDRVDQAVFGTAANYDSYAQQRPEDLAYLKYIIELYRRNPNAPPERVIQHIENTRTRFNQTYRRGDPSAPDKPGSGAARYDYFNGAADLLGSVPGGEVIGLGFIVSIIRQGKEYGEFRYNRRMEPIFRLSSLLKEGAPPKPNASTTAAPSTRRSAWRRTIRASLPSSSPF